jgi:hypothetical protein
MNVAVVHYHLRPGGLSRAISPVFRGFDADDRRVFFTGEVPEAEFPGDVPVAMMSAMEEQADSTLSGEEMAAAMMRQAEAAMGHKPDLWHIFNHAVGKNLALPRAVAALVEQGCPVLLHISDFAEDGRPAAYGHLREADLLKALYPIGMHIHYAVNNRRDYLYLRGLGLSEFQLHYVPNPVAPPAPMAPIDPNSRFLLYATRGVRRKNLGEMALLAACQRDDWHFGVTLPPHRGASDLWSYHHWHRFCDEKKLPVEFGLGQLPDLYFPDLIAKSACFFSSSVAEAFGLGFLEPWLTGRPIIGRAIAEVITEYGSAGVELEHLYEHLYVPIEWVGKDRLRRHTANQWRRSVESFGREPEPDDLGRIQEHWQYKERVDFGFLDEELQTPIIKKVIEDAGAAAAVFLPELQVDEAVVRNNGSAIRQLFSTTAYRSRIQGIYQRVVKCRAESVSYLDPDELLSCFLQPERFALLRGLRPC